MCFLQHSRDQICNEKSKLFIRFSPPKLKMFAHFFACGFLVFLIEFLESTQEQNNNTKTLRRWATTHSIDKPQLRIQQGIFVQIFLYVINLPFLIELLIIGLFVGCCIFIANTLR